MLLINCPHCGDREESEFSYAGDAHKPRPLDPMALNDAEWNEFLFLKENVKGVHYERWMHAAGCRRFFNVARNTVTSQIYASYKSGEPKPVIDVENPEY